MAENEIITREDPQMQLFSQLMEGTLKKLERYCSTARPMLNGEVYLSGEEVCSQLRLSTRTLQEYRNSGTLPFYKIGGKILYKQSDIQAMLEKHYNPIPKKLWQVFSTVLSRNSVVANRKGYFYRRISSKNGKNKGQKAIIRVSGEISPALSQQPPQSRVCIRGNPTKVRLRGAENR